jgi:ATP-dependent 26S proteasome regulatory subunit
MREKTEMYRNANQLTLGFLLNLFDGILETPGRILILTTNNPEKIDSALIRPGRIDINLRLGYCSSEMVKAIYYNFYHRKLNLEIDVSITPAEVQAIFSNNYNNPDEALKILNSLSSTNKN